MRNGENRSANTLTPRSSDIKRRIAYEEENPDAFGGGLPPERRTQRMRRRQPERDDRNYGPEHREHPDGRPRGPRCGTNPDMLEALAQEGLLDYAAMDIKNSPDRYAETCGGVDLLGPVKRSAALLMAGAVDYEFRTTVCAPLHTPEEMAGIGRWLKGAKRYFLQPFVDSGELVGSGMKPLTKEEIEALRDSVLPDIPSTQIRGQ